MGTIRLLWRDADRLPYLYTVANAAAAYGTTIELMKAETREFGELLFDDRTDVVAENYWNQQINRAKGWPLVSLAAAVNTVNEQIVVRDGITSLDDLHGKRIAIRGMHPTDYSDPLWIHQLGLDDAELVFVPEAESGRWAPWKRVVDGDCDAAIVTNLFIAPAFAAGRTFKTDKAAVLKNMELIPQELMQAPNISIASDAEKTAVYESLRDELADPPIPSPQAIANFHEMARPYFPELEGFNPLMMWDLSIARSVLDERQAP
jgi:hypothetical protein